MKHIKVFNKPSVATALVWHDNIDMVLGVRSKSLT